MKTCIKCKDSKDESEFYHKMHTCKTCSIESFKLGEKPIHVKPDQKICSVCYKKKHVTEFYHATRKCKPCFSAIIVENERKRTGAKKREKPNSPTTTVDTFP